MAENRRLAAAWRAGPLSVRNFQFLTAGQFASTIGDYCYAIALPWFVLSAHGSAELLGTVLACYGVPRTVLIPVGGVLADKVTPRVTMLAADVVRCALIAVLAVISTRHTASIGLLGPVAAVIGAGEGLFIPASYAILPSLLDRDQLAPGNALFTAAQQTGSLVGPALGGAVVAVSGPTAAFGVDAASFALSALSLVLITRTAPTAPAEAAAGAEVAGGVLAMLRNTRILQIILLIVIAANLSSGGLGEVALPKLAHERFGAGGFGALLACLAAGSVAGTLAAARGGKLRRPVPVASAAFLVECAAMAAVPYLGGIPGAAAAMVIFGACNGFANVVLVTKFQLWAPPAMLGRLMSLIMLGSFGSFPLSVALTGLIVGHLGSAVFFPIAADMVAVAVLGGLASGDWRAFGTPQAAPRAAPRVAPRVAPPQENTGSMARRRR